MKAGVLATATLILCIPTVASPQARDGVTASRTGSGVVAGVVLVDEPGTPPARRARVTLNTQDRREPGMTTTTDDAGAFVFAGVLSGRYLIQASKTGFLTTDFGAKRPERPGTAVVLKDGERLTGLSMRLTRGGVITGTIFDQNGRPLPDAAVTVLKYSWSVLGERTLGQFSRGGSGATDDRGMYRAWGLPPGEYVVRATMRLTSAPPGAMTEDFRPVSADEMRRVLSSTGRGSGPGTREGSDTPAMPSARPVMFAPAYFRGAVDLDSATTITLGPGEERSGIDFHVQPVPTATITGTVTAPGVLPMPILVTLQQGGKSGLLLGATGGRGGPAARVATDGSFALSGIPPGQYTLIARPPPIAGAGRGGMPAGPSAASFSAMWAQADLTIDGRDASVALDLQPGMTISGRLVFEGSAPPPTNLTAYQVRLIPPGSGGNLGAGPTGGEVNADGRFTFTGVTPGEYRVLFLGSPSSGGGWSLKTSTANGRDAYDTGLRVVAGENVEWTLTYTDTPTRLEGALLNASGGPAPDFFIIAFPINRAQWLPGSRRIATPRPGSDGKYSAALPPGEYYVAALTDLEPGESNNPAFLEQLVGSAIRVTLTDGQVTRQDLRIK